MILLVLGVIAALLGLIVTVVAAFSLSHPVAVSGEIGTRRDITGGLVVAIVLGILLVGGGLATAVRLVRAQMRWTLTPARHAAERRSSSAARRTGS